MQMTKKEAGGSGSYIREWLCKPVLSSPISFLLYAFESSSRITSEDDQHSYAGSEEEETSDVPASSHKQRRVTLADLAGSAHC